MQLNAANFCFNMTWPAMPVQYFMLTIHAIEIFGVFCVIFFPNREELVNFLKQAIGLYMTHLL